MDVLLLKLKSLFLAESRGNKSGVCYNGGNNNSGNGGLIYSRVNDLGGPSGNSETQPSRQSTFIPDYFILTNCLDG